MPECNMLENHMCITVNGAWRPCCRFNEDVQPWNERMRVEDYSFQEYRSSKFYQEIKAAQKTGWHEGCKGCEIAEQTGTSSTRLIFGEKLSGVKDQVEYIEISLSDECNLACKMCGPWASSTWNKIALENTETLEGFIKPQKFTFTADVEKVFNDIDFTHINSVKILGGEPFIVPETKKFLELLDNNGILPNVNIMTNTNVTFFPKKLVKYLTKAKTLSIAMSLDGVNRINDYIRYKSDWQTVLDVIAQWKEFYKNRHDKNSLKFASVINAYNVHQVTEMREFAESNNIELQYNIINSPRYLRLDALPLTYVDELANKYKDTKDHGVYRYLNSIKCNEKYLKELKEYTVRMDKITGINLKDYNLSLAKALDIL